MAITPDQIIELQKENPRFQEAWDTLPYNMQQAYLTGSTIDKVRVLLQNRIPILDRQKERAAQTLKIQAEFQKLGEQAASGDSGEGDEIFKIILASAGVAGIATVSHPNPDTFHCGTDPIIAALQAFDDDDTRVEFDTRTNPSAITVVVFELVSGSWKEAIELTLTRLEENLTKVDMGKIQLAAAAGKVAEIGQTVLDIGMSVTSKRQRGLFDSIQGLFNMATDAVSKITGRLANQIKGVALKTQLWSAIDKAAQPGEDLYWKSKTDSERAAQEVERARLAREALKKCPSCDTAYLSIDTSSANCTGCGFPIPPASLDLLRE